MSAETRDFSKSFTAQDHYIETWMESKRTPGMAVALVDRDRCWRISTYGYADLGTGAPITQDSLFEIGSITKTFTAIAVLQAAEAGLIDLRAPVVRYLPWFQVGGESASIILHHLLNHSAGMVGIIDQPPDIRSAVWMLRDTSPAWEPGEQFYYSDAGYQALALVLGAVTGRPYPDIIQRKIFEPLGMRASAPAQVHAIRPLMAKGYTSIYDDRPPHRSHPLVEAPWIEVSSGDCGIAATVDDMARFAQMLLNRGRGPNESIIQESSFAQMLQDPMNVGWCRYGYGLEIHDYEGTLHIAHGGGMPGYESRIIADMENGLGVVMLSTRPSATSQTWKLMSLWRTAYLGHSLEEIDFTVPDPFHIEHAAEYEGEYHHHGKILRFTAEGDRLAMDAGGEQVALETRGEDAFYAAHPDFDRFLIHFGRDPVREAKNGAVVEAWCGDAWYTNIQYAGPLEFDIPEEWRAYPGHYRSHIPWLTNFRILLRKGALWLALPDGEEEMLVSHPDGSFCVGQPPSPERIQFSQVVEGKALRATLSGSLYYRFFTP